MRGLESAGIPAAVIVGPLAGLGAFLEGTPMEATEGVWYAANVMGAASLMTAFMSMKRTVYRPFAFAARPRLDPASHNAHHVNYGVLGVRL